MAFQEVPLSRLQANDYNPRRRLDDQRLAELKDSIAQVGLIAPLVVRPAADDDGRFEVVAGTRRLHALRDLHGDDHAVPCRVLDLSDDEAEVLALAENLDRDDLTPTEEAEAFAKRVFVTVDKATAEALQAAGDVEVRMAGNNHTLPFRALVDHLNSNGTPRGAPLTFPSQRNTSVQDVADDVAARTPVEIARRCRLYALPEEVWPLVDDGDLPLRQAELIAGLAGTDAPWKERVESMIELARRAVDEAWDKVTCREETTERKGQMAGDGEPSPHSRIADAADEVQDRLDELVGKAIDLVDDVADPSDEKAVLDAVGEQLDALDNEGTADELEEKIAELDALADRLRVGLEHRFQGTVEGFDSRRTYCAYCGQAVTKKEIERALKAVEGHRSDLEGELAGLREERDSLSRVREGLEGALGGSGA